ncbi:MAG TPA: energy transducer TonB [Pyrinomonadaceae bacterium]|nr:energy transducer TonB [Pyrinomonadaceae bacterium]
MNRSRYLLAIVAVLFAGSLQGFGQAQNLNELNRPYQIISQPKATYTDVARGKNIEGAVRLKITLLKTGEVGDVTLIKTRGWKRLQKYGLTEKAMGAARQIRFTPKLVNGKPVSVVITREYTFEIY